MFDEHFKSVVGGAGATAPLGTAAVPQASAAEAASIGPVDVAGVSAGAPTAGEVPSISAPEQKGGKLRRKLGRGFSSRSIIKTSSSTTSSTEAALVTDGDGTIDDSKRRRRRKQRKPTDPTQKTKGGKRKKTTKKGSLDDEYAFKASSDIIGIVQMEIKSACDLPRWKNSLHTGFDMDPMCIVSFSDKIFRTRVQRHTLNPVWDEKLLFHVRRHEAHWKTKLSIFDWDKLSAHDHVGSTEISVADLIEEAPKPDVQTKLYNADVNALERPMRRFELPLSKSVKDKADTKSQSLLVVEAKFTPYDALRQRFWRQMLLNYDSNDSKTISTLELTSMLDSLGSTLGSLTIQEFWQQHNKRPDEDDLTFDEAILSLEAEVNKTWDEKRTARSDGDVSGPASGTVTPAVEVTANALDYSGPNAPIASETQLAKNAGLSSLAAVEPSASENEPSSKRLTPPGASMPGVIARDMSQLSLSSSATSSSANSTSSGPLASAHRGASSGSPFSQHVEGAPKVNSQVKERVIYCKSCPLCHMPRLGRKAEVDIITHLAVCASQDWRRVDSLMVSNFVTASQAQRKWYTKVLTRISQGDYKLGADSANIIVQDRVTGELLEEKMAVYVRLGIRLLYRGGKSRMEGARVRRMLHNMSVKQGAKFDDPASAREIPSFIAFHNLKMDEVLEPLENFKTFNQFFYRKLKPDARPVEELENHKRLVSGADCRMQAFQSVEDSKKFWIKGKQFTIPNLLGDQCKDASAYDNGPLAIFRLAPQDYHRYHSPVDATVGEITPIPGEYYTVNPQAIRSTVEVYCANVRTIVELHTEEFGRVLYVCIGAMLVGSSIQTVKTGDKIKRGDEIGYFAFGGSTILLVFPKGAVEFDKDLLDNSKQSLETLVRVGMGIGRAPQ
ncbi:Phosphatidylserine decarboxylase [Ceraceosorus bombacis]|uniref:Phosphatidylserine decarboxylase proenzyme 2 n=1 Tax=Ceraceosorus bombacis TaxID=401625 RepID=A0A0P1BED2_9BASI|nr:Phosphatidylserine decarboxylase [Ceraceosorus bombacis]